MSTATIKINAQTAGLTGLSMNGNAEFTLATPIIGKSEDITLAVGENTINIPTGTRFFEMHPPTDNNQAIGFRVASGSATNFPLGMTTFTAMSVNGATIFYLLLAAGTSRVCRFNWF